MDNETNGFGQSLKSSILDKVEDFLKTTKLRNYFKFDPIKKFIRLSDIKNDAQKTNLPFAILKNTTSNTLGKGTGFVAGAETFSITKNPGLSTSAEIVTDAAVSTEVNKAFDKTYENTEKAAKEYIKEYIKESKERRQQNEGYGTQYNGFRNKQENTQPQSKPLQTKGFLNDDTSNIYGYYQGYASNWGFNSLEQPQTEQSFIERMGGFDAQKQYDYLSRFACGLNITDNSSSAYETITNSRTYGSVFDTSFGLSFTPPSNTMLTSSVAEAMTAGTNGSQMYVNTDNSSGSSFVSQVSSGLNTMGSTVTALLTTGLFIAEGIAVSVMNAFGMFGLFFIFLF